MNDLISRAAAVDYLMTNMAWRDEDGYEVDDADEKLAIITDLVNGISAAKAQEPFEPYGQYSVHTGTKWIVCGACEKPLCMMKDSYRPKYCPECGRMVKWHANEAEK